MNARDAVLGMSFDELRNSTTFRDTFLRIDADQQTAHLSDSETLQLAREETANIVSQATMGDAKTWGAAAVGTLMGDTMLFKMLAGKGAGGGILKGMGKGAAGEGVSEALEEGTQQYSVNEALNEVAGANIDPMKGLFPLPLRADLSAWGSVAPRVVSVDCAVNTVKWRLKTTRLEMLNLQHRIPCLTSKLSHRLLPSQKYLQRQTNPRLAQELTSLTSCAMCQPICARTIQPIASRGWQKVVRCRTQLLGLPLQLWMSCYRRP